MRYQQIPPPAYLKNHVRFFWILESGAAAAADKVFRPVTDGSPGLMLQQPGKGYFYDQEKQQLPLHFLYGQTIRHRELHVKGALGALGVCFYPNALKTVFGLQAHELTDTCLDLNLLVENQFASLPEALLNAPSVARQMELLSEYLYFQIQKHKAADAGWVNFVLEHFTLSHGNCNFSALLAQLRISERSFERKFKEQIGIPPKLFARICQFQASLQQLRGSGFGKLSDVAFDNGYADQSHFIRSFKTFAGFSPYRYQKQRGAGAEFLTEWQP